MAINVTVSTCLNTLFPIQLGTGKCLQFQGACKKNGCVFVVSVNFRRPMKLFDNSKKNMRRCQMPYTRSLAIDMRFNVYIT